MTDWGLLAQEAAEAHLQLCEQWMDYNEEFDPQEFTRPDGEDPSVGPFCGCTTCIVRETLHAAWPIIERGIRADFAAGLA